MAPKMKRPATAPLLTATPKKRIKKTDTPDNEEQDDLEVQGEASSHKEGEASSEKEEHTKIMEEMIDWLNTEFEPEEKT